MTTRDADVAQLQLLCEDLLALARTDPTSIPSLTSGVRRLLTSQVQKRDTRPANRRPPPAIDPYAIYESEPATLQNRLRELDLEQLRDVVAHYGMDPRRLAMKWKNSERLIAHIIETVEARTRKGDVFRGGSGVARGER